MEGDQQFLVVGIGGDGGLREGRHRRQQHDQQQRAGEQLFHGVLLGGEASLPLACHQGGQCRRLGE